MKARAALKRCVVNAASAGSDRHGGEDAGRRATRSVKIVFEMENVVHRVKGKQLVKDFSAQEFCTATRLR